MSSLRISIFVPALRGDPVWFQHLFWFYSYPAVYIMVLPSMGVIGALPLNCIDLHIGMRFA